MRDAVGGETETDGAGAFTVALVGGTGKLGSALALRLALGGHRVVIGSRDAARARQSAAEANDRLGARLHPIAGDSNGRAVEHADVVVVTVPYDAQAATLRDLAAAVGDRVVVSTAVPVRFTGGQPEHVAVPEGSACEQVAVLLPGARVVGALHTVSSATLGKLDREVAADVIVTGDDDGAKRVAAGILSALPGVRAVDGGPLRNARYVEQFTVLLLAINMRARRNTGIRITNLPDEMTLAVAQPVAAVP